MGGKEIGIQHFLSLGSEASSSLGIVGTCRLPWAPFNKRFVCGSALESETTLRSKRTQRHVGTGSQRKAVGRLSEPELLRGAVNSLLQPLLATDEVRLTNWLPEASCY